MASTPSIFKMASANMYGLRTKVYSAIFSESVKVILPPNMSNAPHMRLKYVNAPCVSAGSIASLSAMTGVKVAAMCTNPISIMPTDSVFVMFCLFNLIILLISRKWF